VADDDQARWSHGLLTDSRACWWQPRGSHLPPGGPRPGPPRRPPMRRRAAPVGEDAGRSPMVAGMRSTPTSSGPFGPLRHGSGASTVDALAAWGEAICRPVGEGRR